MMQTRFSHNSVNQFLKIFLIFWNHCDIGIQMSLREIDPSPGPNPNLNPNLNLNLILILILILTEIKCSAANLLFFLNRYRRRRR